MFIPLGIALYVTNYYSNKLEERIESKEGEVRAEKIEENRMFAIDNDLIKLVGFEDER